MDTIREEGNIIITGHILIRDKVTKEVLLNKSESSLVDITVNNKKEDEQDEG